jgi:hypothetical protein
MSTSVSLKVLAAEVVVNADKGTLPPGDHRLGRSHLGAVPGLVHSGLRSRCARPRTATVGGLESVVLCDSGRKRIVNQPK